MYCRRIYYIRIQKYSNITSKFDFFSMAILIYDVNKKELIKIHLLSFHVKMALSLLYSSIELGYWLMLQNCHLLIPFMYKLEKVLDGISKVHPDFRLWLATDATPSFPVAILQRSLKGISIT